VASTLAQYSQTIEFANQKYPRVILILDYPEDHTNIGYIGVRLQLLIVTNSDPTYKADKRYALNFVPTLYPIYDKLIKAIKSSPYIDNMVVEHEKIDRYALSSALNESILSDGRPLLNDNLDGIEIRNLNIKFINNCK
jgi:hypothetical protein